MKKLSIILCMLLLMCNASLATTYYENDVTPPWGKISIEGGTVSNGVTYVENENITVKIEAKDDMCNKEEIKYYLSTSKIEGNTVINESDWKSLADGDTAEIKLASASGVQHVYAVFKDLNGNTSFVSTNKNQTLKFDVNGGTNAPVGIGTTRYYGEPFTLTSQMPTKDGAYFIGWSTDPMATAPSFRGGDIIPADMVIAGDTLYAVYTTEIENLPVVSEKLEVSDKVNLSIPYSNVEVNGNKSNYTGWKVLSENDDGSINLVSSGTPVTFYHGTNAQESIESLTTNFLTTLYDSNGFESSNLEEVFNSNYIKKDANGNPMVRALNAEDILKVTNKSQMELGNTMNLTQVSYEYIFDNDTDYWVATNNGSNNLYTINASGEVGVANNKEYGVRVVITIKGDIRVAEKDVLDAWNVENVKYMDLIQSKANEPVLGDGMKAVYWTGENGTGETTATAYTTSMYNYTIGDGENDTKDNKWANAITIDDGSYWVWIPRYAYKITYTNEDKSELKGQTTSTATIDGEKTQYGNIDILFMHGKSNTHYRDENGNAVALPDGYKVHPAFQAMSTAEDLATNPLGKWDEELEGIWVAKYEASMETTTDGGATWTNTNTSSSIGDVLTSSTVRVVSKPSVISWRNIRQNYLYQNSLNMHEELNSHEMKNSEWGAVAYLTESAYGRNGNEIAVNQCSSYYTGAGPGSGESTVYNSEYSYSSSTFANQYAWNTEQGKLASTTGNIYGVYDISGGAHEYTAAYVDNGSSYISIDSCGGVLGTEEAELKTKQVYASEVSGESSTASTDYAANSGLYGDAVYETSTSGSILSGSWHSDYSYFPDSNNPFFKRGGNNNIAGSAGAFGFYGNNGYINTPSGFRPVLCVSDEYKVTLDANGGTLAKDSIKVVKGGTYGDLPTPEKVGYAFDGWYTEADVKVTSTTTIVKNANHTLTAKWKVKGLMDLIPSKANAPVLGEGMKAVYWTNANGTGETTATAYTSSMYNYTIGDGKTDSKDSKWANAITEEDGSYWVWIPRYAYKITYTTDANKTAVSNTKTQYGNIDILFMDGKSNTHYRDENGNAVVLPDGYKVHPAFQAMTTNEDLATNPLGKWDEELEGIWVAKYEASMETTTDGGTTWENTDTSSDTIGNVLTSETTRIVSKPSVISWRYISQNNIYQNSLNMHEELNSHEMKNSEWGAVAYLTESAYGRNGKEIAVNQCESFYTGAGPGTGTSTVYNSTYSYDANNFAGTYAWNTEQGKLASTTGNIYGVYDLSGGAYEYTAAYADNGHTRLSGDSYGGVLGTDEVELKTKQVYASEGSGGTSDRTTDYAANSTVYGDAVYETSTSGRTLYGSWYSDCSYFPYSNGPFFSRGGTYNNANIAGAFSFGNGYGNHNSYYGFRPVLSVSSGT